MTGDAGRRRPAGTEDPEAKRTSIEEFKRLIDEAKKRGEDAVPIIKRLVLQVIAETRDGLDR